MNFSYETDLRTGKRFFNPQQDIVNRGIKSQTKSLRHRQDLLAYIYFSRFISRIDKSDISQAIEQLEYSRKALVSCQGYHQDTPSKYPLREIAKTIQFSDQITSLHPWLTRLYYASSLLHSRPYSVSKQIEWSLKGGPYFQKWQRKSQEKEKVC